MNIHKIKIQNFKSIYDPLELNFQDIKGLWKISGDVGSGKTTIGEAIIFGLFGSVKGKTNGDLISWGEKHGIIELRCEAKGNNMYIKRELNVYGQCPIYVQINGEDMIFTDKRNAQKQLEEEYYDITRTSIELLCIISFNNFKSLATLSASDAKKFLDKALGFYILTQYNDICKVFRSENNEKIREVSVEIGSLRKQISKIDELNNRDIIEGDKKEVKEEIKKRKEEEEQIINERDERTGKINNSIIENKNQLTTIKTIGVNKAKEIKIMEGGVCPVCGSIIDKKHIEEKKAEKQLLLSQYKIVSDDTDRLVKELQSLKNEYNNTLQSITIEIDRLKREYIQLTEQEKRRDINNIEIEAIRKKVDACEETLKVLYETDKEWEKLSGVLSYDIRSCILQNFIPLLNKNILKYSQMLQQPYIISFDSEFKCNINLWNYDKDISLSNLSTGQLKMVDMTIILGVLNTILRGKTCNIIFLDELFSNLDIVLRNKMCEVLKGFIEPGQTIFIISHTDLDNKYFDGMIDAKIELKNNFDKHSYFNVVKN